MECRSCGAEIQFGVTEKGRRMPLDAEPDLMGEWTLIPREKGEPDVVRAATDTPMEQRFQSHFSTCPEGHKWSKKRKGGKKR